jgi:polyhydroxybutyrate depolymerase
MRALLTAVGLAGLVTAPAMAGRSVAPGLAPGDYDLRLTHDGRERTYLVHVPPGGRRAEPRPVVLSFHGAGSRASDHRGWSGLDPVADREGFLAVYPDGTGYLRRNFLTWNAGRCCGWARRHGVDDVGFVRALLADLSRRAAVDHTRVYATGFSNGAMLVYRLAVEGGPLLAAIAPVGGAMVVESFAPRHLMPVMHFHSVDDARAPYAGGPGPLLPWFRRVVHPPVEETIAQWRRNNGCAEAPHVGARIRGTAPSETAHSAEALVYGPCWGGTEVVLWKLTGAGHVWPGAPPTYPRLLLGEPTRVVDASETMWRFFRRFSRPDAPPPEGVRAAALP